MRTSERICEANLGRFSKENLLKNLCKTFKVILNNMKQDWKDFFKKNDLRELSVGILERISWGFEEELF